jgi:medium-chain acyl-[acyl-carrier-protein] hydrolase
MSMNRHINRSTSQWFISTDKPGIETRLRIFCFPYSGGGVSIFYDWSKHFPQDISIMALQLPGHESRMAEELVSDLNLLIDKLVVAITPYLDKPYIFFGHSLGALISFELTHRLKKMNVYLPKCLIVSGRAAPHTPSKNGIIHNLPNHEFIAKLKEYNGLPEIILHNQELLDLFLPIIRADFKLSESYLHMKYEPLPVPIIALAGKNDYNVIIENVALWMEHTTKSFKKYLLPGDHFFIKTHLREVLNIIQDVIKQNNI